MGARLYVLARERRLGGHRLRLKERQRQLLHRDYIGTMQGLLDTKPTPETARMPVRVDMERLYIETFHVGITNLELSPQTYIETARMQFKISDPDMERLYVETLHVNSHRHPGRFWCRFGIQEPLCSSRRVAFLSASNDVHFA